MRALLKTGELVEIDTQYLFNDQYNTLPGEGGTENGRRIFDGDVPGSMMTPVSEWESAGIAEP